MLRFAKLATPLAAATVVVPPRVPLPGLVPIARFTSLMAPVARLPRASRISTCTAGVIANPATVLVGWAMKASAAGAPGVTVTVGACVIATPLAVADTVLGPATVDHRVPVAMPLALVTPAGCVTVLPVPVAEICTVAPLTGLPLASRAVTVMVDTLAPLLAVIVAGEALTPDCAADTTGPLEPAARISMPTAPPLRLLQLASMVGSPTERSTMRSDWVPSPEACSLISVNPAPGVIRGALVAAPNAPNATLPVVPKTPRLTPRPLTASPAFTPVCPMASAPFTPPVSTPCHCDTTHCAFD